MNARASMLWLQTYNQKWHAWPRGGRQTCCGKINVEHLRQRPALQMQKSAPALEEAVCKVCRELSGYAASTQPLEDTTQAAWMGFLRRHVAHKRLRVAQAVLAELARRLAEIGAPTDPAAQEVYDQVRVLFLTPRFRHIKVGDRQRTITSLPYLKASLDALPPTPGILTQIAGTMKCWRTITKRNPTDDKFRPDQVISTMLQIKAPEDYIRHLTDRGLPYLAAIFHPRTLARAQKDTALRGLFAGGAEYWDKTKDQLNIVTD